MPRARGGSRTGTPGTTYANRTDLQANAGKPLPVQTPKSPQYGAGQASVNAQKTVPMAPNPLPGVPSQASPSETPAPPPTPSAIPPGGFGDPLRATERPAEPITTGLPTGAGPGPEALTMNQPQFTASPLQTAAGHLAALSATASPQVRALQAQLSVTMNNQVQQ